MRHDCISHDPENRILSNTDGFVARFLSRLCTEPQIRSNEVLIRWNGRFGFRGTEVEIVATSGKARSDLRQISAEMSGVHPMVTLSGDSSAVLEFNLRSATG